MVKSGRLKRKEIHPRRRITPKKQNTKRKKQVGGRRKTSKRKRKQKSKKQYGGQPPTPPTPTTPPIPQWYKYYHGKKTRHEAKLLLRVSASKKTRESLHGKYLFFSDSEKNDKLTLLYINFIPPRG